MSTCDPNSTPAPTPQDQTPKKRSWLRFLKYLLLIPLTLAVLFVVYTYLKTHSQPYPMDIDESLIARFTPVSLDFTHKHDSSSLPFLGSCIIDIDGDHVPEVFLGGGKNQEDALFRFQDGKFVAVEKCAGISKTLPDATYGAATIDVDNDGDTDLFVARDSGITLYINNNGTFTGKLLKIPFDEKSTPLSITLADLNRDGFVDMYVANYLPTAKMEGLNIFNKEGYGANSLLLLNNGDNTFRDITDESGMRYTHNTFLGVFIDVDEDREPDLIVAHDTGHVKTWKNLGGLKFRDMPNPTTNIYSYPMGIGVGDYDQDGLPDFFFSNTGGTAPQFLAKGDLRSDQVFKDCLLFFRNQGKFQFEDIAEKTKTANYEFSWGTVLHDLNLDGRQDLIISQNFISLPVNTLFRLPCRLLIQRPDGTYAATEDRAGVVNRRFEITTLVADFNRDGYPDLVKVNLNGPALAYLNQGGDRHYLQVRLPDTAASIGAKVRVTLDDDSTLTDWFVVGEGLCCDLTHTLTFGLGKCKACKKVEIHYLDGRKQTIENPAIDRLLEVPVAK